jgi:hypothetical protein
LVAEPPFPELSGRLSPVPPPSELVAELVLPAERFVGVARMVVAGVATRLDLPFDEVDDLQLALESVLRVVFVAAGEATVRVSIGADALAVAIGPAGPELLARNLREDEPWQSMDLRTLLGRLVDRVAARPEPVPSIELCVELPAR